MNRPEIRAWVDERRDAIVQLLSDMVAIDSVTGNEGPLAEHCAGWLREHGIEAILQPCKGRHNVLGVVGSGEPALIVSGHLDTVPPNQGEWTYGPFTPTIADGKLYGLGTSDLHASTVGAYFASLFLRDAGLPGRLVTAFTIEEETTGDGTIGFLEWAERERFLDFSRTQCVVTEPTGLDQICLGNRGSSFLVLRVQGLGGHGSRPHLSRNPIDKLRAVLDGLDELERRWAERYPDAEFGHTTLTPTAFNAGELDRTNVIPEVAEAVVDCRPTPTLYREDLKLFRAELGECLRGFEEEGYEISVEELYPREGHKLDQAHPLAQTVMRVVREDLGRPQAEFRYTPAGNDAVFFGIKGIPTINKVGPGHPECAHRVDEHVSLENLFLGVELYTWIALRHFGLVS
jgi:acetylornithine deacetylase/succinyl-diaminopimelate desuccinylase-like protein